MNKKTKIRLSPSTRMLYALMLFFLLTSFVYAGTSKIYLCKIDGVIGPPMADYLIRNITIAEENNASAILLEINTPGGLSVSMRKIVSEIMRTPLPVIGYVTPEGAHAASAGAIIMLACDIAAMTPTSSIGAAHPVNMGGKIDSTMEKKVINDMISYVQSLAEKKDRNAEIAAEMVIESISLTAKEAKKANIIEYIAKSRDDLFSQINGLEISKNDETFIMNTKDAIVVKREMNFIERFLFHIKQSQYRLHSAYAGHLWNYRRILKPGNRFCRSFWNNRPAYRFFCPFKSPDKYRWHPADCGRNYLNNPRNTSTILRHTGNRRSCGNSFRLDDVDQLERTFSANINYVNNRNRSIFASFFPLVIYSCSQNLQEAGYYRQRR